MPTFSCDFVAKGCIAITDVFMDLDDLAVFSESSEIIMKLIFYGDKPEYPPTGAGIRPFVRGLYGQLTS